MERIDAGGTGCTKEKEGKNKEEERQGGSKEVEAGVDESNRRGSKITSRGGKCEMIRRERKRKRKRKRELCGRGGRVN